MSSSLIRLIDKSILPSALLVLGKVLGLYLTIRFFNLEWQVNFVNNSLISVYPVVFAKDLDVVSSYSDLVMMVVVLSGYLAVAIRSTYFHDTHIDPKLVVKLAKFNLLSLIKNSTKIYYGALVWFIFSFLGVLTVAYNTVYQRTYPWVFLLSLLGFACISIFLVKDIEKEFHASKENIEF